MPSRPFGLYVHFPWCSTRCPYCDFAVTTTRPVPDERYADAVIAEIGRRAPAFAGRACATLFLGGGTPSLWAPESIARVVAAARGLGLRPGAEVTLEANPESADAARAAAWKAAGVTRVSIGVQSFDRDVLRKLGRRHGPEDAERAIREVAGVIPNVSVDLIQGGRRSSEGTALADAERVASLPVAHVSAYALTLDADVLAEDVPLARLARAGRLTFPGEEEVASQGRAVAGVLARAGFRRYEISNFARPGMESRHNLLYWRSEDYLGAGAGAVGCVRWPGGGRRWTNHREVGPWLAAVEAGALPDASEEPLGPAELASERVLLALRTAEGLPLAELPARTEREVEALVSNGLATVEGGRLRLSAAGMDLHSAVVARLIQGAGPTSIGSP
ncbi:MAG TPA: radical SAM family heme chaperone HemW [Anaeromyxobacteraceae bacterium]|nr:radical SAM family heme chaperone HemW [Anaeromyxobacteraceae bacterium]